MADDGFVPGAWQPGVFANDNAVVKPQVEQLGGGGGAPTEGGGVQVPSFAFGGVNRYTPGVGYNYGGGGGGYGGPQQQMSFANQMQMAHFQQGQYQYGQQRQDRVAQEQQQYSQHARDQLWQAQQNAGRFQYGNDILNRLSDQSFRDLNEQYADLGQREQQGLISRGLGASTILGTMMSGVQREKMGAENRLLDNISGQRMHLLPYAGGYGGSGGGMAYGGGGMPVAPQGGYGGSNSYGGWAQTGARNPYGQAQRMGSAMSYPGWTG